MSIEAKPGMRRRFRSIQILRGLAAMSIVVLHASMIAGFPLYPLAFGVDLFFAISGFLMVAITHDQSKPAAFIKDRILRIVPVYWIATIAFVACQLALGYMPDINFRHIAASLLFIPYQPLGAVDVHPVLAAGWTLNYEMFFYALFAASLLLPVKFRLPVLSAVFLLLVAAGLILRPANPAMGFWTSPIILEFLAGAWLAYFLPEPKSRPIVGYSLVFVGIVVLLGLLVFAMVSGAGDPGLDLRASNALRSFAAVPAVLVLAGALNLETDRAPGRFGMFGIRLGDASYSIYLWQVAVFSLAAFWAASAQPSGGLYFLVICASCLCIGFLAYRLIEYPLLTFLRRRKYTPAGIPIPSGP